MIIYEVAEYQSGDKTVEMTFSNDEGFVHKRQVNIPYNADGTIDEDYLQEIFKSQLRGLENKIKVGTITFTEPTPEPVGILTA